MGTKKTVYAAIVVFLMIPLMSVGLVLGFVKHPAFLLLVVAAIAFIVIGAKVIGKAAKSGTI